MTEIVGDNRTAPSGQLTKSSWMSTLASTAVVIAALYMAKSLLVPLTLAVLLSFLLMPVCDWLERRQIGPYPGCVDDGHPGLHDARGRGLDRSRSNDPFGPQDPRVSEQYPGEAKLGERVRGSRAEQDNRKTRRALARIPCCQNRPPSHL